MMIRGPTNLDVDEDLKLTIFWTNDVTERGTTVVRIFMIM